ncbi:MAG: B12-binding domain-containing radical SAM protein [Candidatus Thorarchaeota archaeon]
MTENLLIVDALSAGSGKRRSSRDSIGCGPRAIAGIYESEGLRCRIQRIESILELPNTIRKYDHLAVSAMSMDLPSVKQILSIWRRSKSRGRIILGGPIASDPENILNALKPDVLVIGEGEETLHELLSCNYLTENVDLSTIKGIGYLEDKKGHLTAPRPLLEPEHLWTKYPPSAIRIIDYPVYQASKVYVEAIRGCSNFRRTSLMMQDGRSCSECGNCDDETPEVRLDCPEDIPPGCGFCSVPSVWGAPRSRPMDSIVSEISILLDLGVHRIVLEAPDFLDYMRGSYPMTDPCSPGTNIESIQDLVQRIMSLPQFVEGLAHLAIENMKSCLFNEDIAKTLASVLKTTSPNIGLETGSEEHSRQIGKCGSPADVVRAVQLAVKYGMKPFVYFIYGLPGENESTVEESVKVMNRLAEVGAERIIMYGFRPLPSSAFADFPAPEPRDPLSERMRAEASRINRARKVDYVGQVIRGIAAEPSWDKHGFTMVYPMGEGPLMTVEGGYSAGTILDIEITDVLSPGLLGGRTIRR